MNSNTYDFLERESLPETATMDEAIGKEESVRALYVYDEFDATDEARGFTNDDIKKFRSVEYLRVGSELVLDEAAAFENFTKTVRVIDMSGADIEWWTEGIGAFTNVEEIRLGSNPLCGNPEWFVADIERLTKLEVLDFYSAGISFIPDPVRNLTSLRHLNFADTYLEELPNDLSNLSNLEFLALGGEFDEIPPNFFEGLAKLERLYISSTELAEIPVSIGALTALEAVYFYCCYSLTSLPDELLELPNLKTVHTYRCNFDDAEQERLRSKLAAHVDLTIDTPAAGP